MTLLVNQTTCHLLKKGYFAQARDRIQNIKFNINEVDENGRTILILCSFIDETAWSLSLARFVIQLDADLAKRDYLYNMNVLHYCCILERTELLELLLESVDFDINAGDCYGNTPLIYAITVNNPLLIDFLIKFYQRYKINVDKTNVKGVNALMQACLIGNRDLMNQLIDMGADLGIKDAGGRSTAQYKDEAITKSDLIIQFNENRKLSRIVRFDDLEQIIKLQQETKTLQQNSNNMPEINDPNVERVREIQMRLKRLKRNKIDYTYVCKSFQTCAEHHRNMGHIDQSIIRKIRPKTAGLTSQEIKQRGDWYSMVGPLFVSLEQQCASSFRSANRYEDQALSHETSAERYRNRGRRYSRSNTSQSRKNSISGKLAMSDDDNDSVFVAPKGRKKNDAIASAKTLLRNISRFGIRSSNSSLNKT